MSKTDTTSFQIQSIISHDIDHLSEIVKPWDLFIRKLDRGTFYGKADLLMSEDLVIYKTDFSGILEQIGAPPKGMRTVWLPVNSSQNFYWRKSTINGNTIGFFPQGAELEATTKPGFQVYVISMPDQLLVEGARNLGYDWSIVDKPGFRDHLIVDDRTISKMQSIMSQMFLIKTMTINFERQNGTLSSLKHELINTFLINILQRDIELKPDLSNRQRVFARFRDYIKLFPHASFSSSELCAYTGASERTLQYVVKYYTQLTPNQYAKALKLNMVRKALQDNDKNMKIGQLALEHGFWHNAQFAADYRIHFGERPSETMNG